VEELFVQFQQSLGGLVWLAVERLAIFQLVV
jgi:hypothetical protein